MERMLVVAVAVFGFAVILASSPVTAQGLATVRGGGTGTFGADLDGDGRIDGSQFGVGAILLGGGKARGHFECLMAGRSQILGLSLMAVEGTVREGAMNADGSVTLRGVATVNLGGGLLLRGVPFEVRLEPGGRGVGHLTLTVIGAFDRVPGDTVPDNGNYDLPKETVASGRISIASS